MAQNGEHGTISPLSVLLTVHALAEFCDHINSKLHHSKLEYNQGRSQTGYSAGLNVFSFRKSTAILLYMELNLMQQKLEVAKLDRYFLP